jgi:hypothetical protein
MVFMFFDVKFTFDYYNKYITLGLLNYLAY